MNETFFPINDLLRRKYQTSFAVVTLALSVAATLSLLLFCDKVGFGFSSKENVLTRGLSAIFSQFTIFCGILIFGVGAVVTVFIAYLMMTQRTRDFGLIKAAGCPNGLVGGYLMTELFLITLIGCTIGTVSGILIDYMVSCIGGFQVLQRSLNWWIVLLVFAVYFAIAFAFGIKPILKAARMAPIKALSPVNYFGLTANKQIKLVSGRNLMWRMAHRSLVRRQSATIRIVVLLSIVFTLLTVVVAGGIIASDTTVSWMEKTSDRELVAIAHTEMAQQYAFLMSKFTGRENEKGGFSYLDEKLRISGEVVQMLIRLPGVSSVEEQLISKEHVREISNFTIDPETLATLPVGDNREADLLVVGIDSMKTNAEWYLKGRPLNSNAAAEAVIGDSVAFVMFSPNRAKRIVLSDPLVQGVEIRNEGFRIVGVCVDPINNGQVIYVPIQKLKNTTNAAYPNIVFVKIAVSADLKTTVAEIQNAITATNPNLSVIRVAEIADEMSLFFHPFGPR